MEESNSSLDGTFTSPANNENAKEVPTDVVSVVSLVETDDLARNSEPISNEQSMETVSESTVDKVHESEVEACEDQLPDSEQVVKPQSVNDSDSENNTGSVSIVEDIVQSSSETIDTSGKDSQSSEEVIDKNEEDITKINEDKNENKEDITESSQELVEKDEGDIKLNCEEMDTQEDVTKSIVEEDKTQAITQITQEEQTESKCTFSMKESTDLKENGNLSEISMSFEISEEQNKDDLAMDTTEINDVTTDAEESHKSNSVNDEKGNKSNDALENDTDIGQNENTEFVHVNAEKEDNEKDMQKTDEILEDPIGGDNNSDNMDSVVEGGDEELCIIPDTERVLSQEEKDAACTLSPLKDLSATTAENGESIESSESQESIITIAKYNDQEEHSCYKCSEVGTPKYKFKKDDVEHHLCGDECLEKLKKSEKEKIVLNWESHIRVKDLAPKSAIELNRSCSSCKEDISNNQTNLVWEIMDFCNEVCLTKYQKEIGSKCTSCSGDVRTNSLGKYCVRFGNDIRQFCTSHCLEEYKKGLKVCSYCQQDMSAGAEGKGFLAIGDKGQFKDFCSQACMEKYDIMTNNRPPKVDAETTCGVCKLSKPITMAYDHDGTKNYFCSEPCFVAFSFVNNIKSDKCAMCRRNFAKETLEKHSMLYENSQLSFCSNSCQNIYIIAHRKIVSCNWCKVKKYNFDMIRKMDRNEPILSMCSVNCLNLYQVSLNAVNSKKTECDYCFKNLQAMYHLTMSDATIRNFCSYVCVMSFQNQFTKSPISMDDENFPIPTGTPKRSNKFKGADGNPSSGVLSNVQSLTNSNGTAHNNSRTTRSKAGTGPPPLVALHDNTEIPVQVKHHIILKNGQMPAQRNISTMCRPRVNNKGVNAIPKVESVHTQTERREADKILIPIPVPIFVPLPMHMFAAPVPMPVPIPIPVPVPIFIPTTRNSANGIMKEIKKIQVKIPTNPYEAELLMMAEMVADDKKEENTDSESDVEDTGADDTGGFSPEPQDGSNTFGDDMLQMALKMASELDEPAVDLEGALTANTITATQTQDEVHAETTEEVAQEQLHLMDRGQRGRKRGMRGNARGQSGGISKRGRRSLSQHIEMPMMQQPPPPPEPQEKPDANMCLKYTFGVNAWKQWVTFKNAELEKSRRVKLFKTEILQLTADELNYSLCLFVKEVRKPNGAEYAPDTIYYLCLGIQQYLFENGRIDNIFCDAYYEKFTDCLDEVAKKFSVLYNDSHYIVTRVEEEHLWESKQLGAHSPHVLLSTLMFFNTKHFNLTTVDEHMQLSFSHIMKHWKRNPNQAGTSKIPGSRNVLLRFYPPQSAIQNNARKKKVYEQQENEENPLRCPVKLYEFYLSKCPESVKTRNDVFYLQPERSCVPDSPVWYSTMPLPRDALEKMLHRVKMVKEINVALLTS